MSDKGFGDQPSKNVMKNPLLSTAVIGVSLDDLTHNAVLLPAVPSQELITRQDEQIGPQGTSLRHSEQNTPDFSSGDANANHMRTQTFSNVTNPRSLSTAITGRDKNTEASKTVVSNADDDFDVNEYFARLQGTRYVSAPLNSAKEDIGTELEENLEEINLNEPDKPIVEDIQHSLTADIAQNFSQLPTVLPQVASAVFSSFSNMLSMKSREQTPDEGRPPPEYQAQRTEEIGVPLMGVTDIVKDVAPPPKEPPTIGTASNYRITTRKKMYAPIPGLRSGDTSQNLPLASASLGLTNAPSFFTPETTDATDNNFNLTTAAIPHQSNVQYTQTPPKLDKPLDNNASNVGVETNQNNSQQFSYSVSVDDKQTADHDQMKPISLFDNNNRPDPKNQQSVVTMSKSSQMDYFQPQLSQTISVDTPQPTVAPAASNVPVIPPPPMFSNLPKSEGQNNLRSVLPPSIARRISASNPVIKPQAPPLFVPTHNIFVPTSDISTHPLAEENISHAEINSAATLMSNQFTATQQNKTSNIESQQNPSVEIFNTPRGLPPTIFQTANAPASKEMQTTRKPEKDVPPKLPFNISQPSDLSVTHLSQLNLEPPITNIAEELKSETPIVPPHTVMSLKNMAHFQSTSPTSVPPTMVINPNFVSAFNVKSNQDTKPTELKEKGVTESAKPISEPPKLSSTQNFRMTKKRPQYYSGPIEGVGNISNNIKPTIDAAQTNTFQGTLYTPQFSSESTPSNSGMSSSQFDRTPDVPFDITHTSTDITAATTSYPDYNIDQSQMSSNVQPDYNTAFDLSRQTTEYFDRPQQQQESKGFGIIGSLKSKLSSIDINKIQNTVTTFFDPAYNYTKMDASVKQEDVGYDAMNQGASTYLNQFGTSQNNLEIYVPTADPTSHVGYHYKMNENRNVHIAPDNVYYPPSNNTYSYFGNQTDNTFAPSTYRIEANHSKLVTNVNSPPTEYTFAISGNVQNIPKGLEDRTANTYKSDPRKESTAIGSVPSFYNPGMGSNFETHHQAHNLFDSSFTHELKSDAETDHKSYMPTVQHDVEEKGPIQTDFLLSELASKDSVAKFHPIDMNPTKSNNLVQSITEEKNEYISHATKEKYTAELENSAIKFFDQTTESSKLSLISEPTSDSLKQVTGIDNQMKNINLFEKCQNQDVLYFDQSAASFFETATTSATEGNIPLNDEQENENNDLNICETCREVNKPEEKEVENLTDQLIENITAPIQLSNPVEVPLPETNVPDVSTSSFETDQCAEITHITEETIESIHVQAATELLDDTEDNSAVIRNYGWSTDDTPLTSSNVLMEHDYTFQQPDVSSIGFFQNKSLFFDNMPTNASDEIKAEYKNSFDDTLPVLPRQLSIPTAPPAEEDDTKSDESGLDVQSIEQDAKKDFPIFEEYVIDPSETDDDKIEFREREKSDDPPHDVDTFTNRVERYKKMEVTHAEPLDDVFEAHKSSKPFEIPTSISPPMTIASYFDTGNYAVENHYRNSLTSPSNLHSIQSIAQSSLMRVPPGFEDEFQRKLSLVSNEGFLTTDKEEFAKYIQELPPHSNLSTALTASQLSIDPSNFLSQETEDVMKQPSEKSHSESVDDLSETIPQTDVKLPDFASIFGKKCEEVHDQNQSISTSFSKDTPESNVETTNQSQNAEETLVFKPILFQSEAAPVSTETSDVYDFSRLSSYFSAPTQADPSKSFFELSQSQDHYRQETSTSKGVLGVACDSSTIGNTAPSTNNLNNKLNIPHETVIANMNLMKDLTSPANISFIPKDQTVRSVNFFTVVYDDDTLNTVSVKKGKTKTSNTGKLEKSDSISKKLVETGSKGNDLVTDPSQHCCNTEAGIDSDINIKKLDSSKVKCRKLMNGNSSDAKNDIDVMEKNKEDGGRSVTVNFDPYIQEEKEDSVSIMTENRSSGEYSPVKHHWFYRVDQEDKPVWKGFSNVDSTALENAHNSPDLDDKTVVATDGGRYDVHVVGRLRVPVYWSDKPTNVMRCSWFYRGNSDARYVPYPESVALKLEEEYKHGIRTGDWHRRLSLPDGEMVVMHGPSVMVHFSQGANDPFAAAPRFIFTKWVYRAPLKIKYPDDQMKNLDQLLLFLHGAGHHGYGQTAIRPMVVRRGCVESEIEDSEPSQVDHLLLLCHGVGSACDMRFRPVEEVVDDFRATSLQLIQSHYKNSYESGIVGRIEVLPVSWHSALHSGENGVDRRLAQITLDSIPRLRSFTNDTVLDVLFYTSPVYCQTIVDTVCKEMNRIYSIFKARNPTFNGGVSLGGHSLGSVILYDLLCHQTHQETSSPGKRYVTGSAGTGQPTVKYPQLQFNPDVLYALGSPIAIFECIRGVEQLGQEFRLPTCKKFFNIFHPYDPIAYRIEPLINPQLKNVKPFQIPHHKGRKRMHLELKDTMARVGADLKQKLIESIRSTWSSMWKTQPPNDHQLEKVVEEEMEKEQLTEEAKEETANDNEATPEMLGQLNGGRRVDYVLQEAPFEMINEYLFAMRSHVCYWLSEDTMLLVLREVYSGKGVQPDGCRPQGNMTVQRTRTAVKNDADDFTIIGSDFPSTSRDAY